MLIRKYFIKVLFLQRVIATKIEIMDPCTKKFGDLLFNDRINSVPALLDKFDYMMTTQEFGLIQTDILMADEDLMKSIEKFDCTKASLYFGETLCDLNFVISDEKGRKLNMWVKYVAPQRFCVKDIDIAHSYIKDQSFNTLDEAVDIFVQDVNKLSNYFHQLDRIKQLCTIFEPVKPTYKENYRKILLADGLLLHVEVSEDGSAKKLQFSGPCQQHSKKLQDLLQNWDHNEDIATCILTIVRSLKADNSFVKEVVEDRESQQVKNKNPCNICLCFELSDKLSKSRPSIPQPLCSNTCQGGYFHRSCLYQWLVACNGGRPPLFGVAIGVCPDCSQPIQCNEKDI